jgi:hypothetical protein
VKIEIWTLWAAMKGGDPSPWMIAAEDEYSWEGDPDRCERVFQEARDLADRNEWEYREVKISVEISEIAACFEHGSIEGEVVA